MGMRKKINILLGFSVLLLLVSCSRQTSEIYTTGTLDIISTVPDVTAGCPVRAGDWMTLTGNDFGRQADWETGGPNYVLFPPEPGLPPERVELTKVANPATLFLQVPVGAQSGTLKLHVKDVGDAEIIIEVVSGSSSQTAVPGCELPTPPAD